MCGNVNGLTLIYTRRNLEASSGDDLRHVFIETLAVGPCTLSYRARQGQSYQAVPVPHAMMQAYYIPHSNPFHTCLCACLSLSANPKRVTQTQPSTSNQTDHIVNVHHLCPPAPLLSLTDDRLLLQHTWIPVHTRGLLEFSDTV